MRSRTAGDSVLISDYVGAVAAHLVEKYGVYTFEEVIDSCQCVGLKLIYQEGPRGFMFKPFTIVVQNN